MVRIEFERVLYGTPYLISWNWPLTEPSGFSTITFDPDRRVVKQRSCPARIVFQVVQ